MASLYPKKIRGKTYWYLREMGRVDGKPKMVSERYLGTAADIAAAIPLPPPQLVGDLPEHPLRPPPGHPANHGPAEQVQPAAHPLSHRGHLTRGLAARAGHYPAHGRYLAHGRPAATPALPREHPPSLARCSPPPPGAGTAHPRGPQRGSREAPERSGTGAHLRRRPADLEAGLDEFAAAGRHRTPGSCAWRAPQDSSPTRFVDAGAQVHLCWDGVQPRRQPPRHPAAGMGTHRDHCRAYGQRTRALRRQHRRLPRRHLRTRRLRAVRQPRSHAPAHTPPGGDPGRPP